MKEKTKPRKATPGGVAAVAASDLRSTAPTFRGAMKSGRWVYDDPETEAASIKSRDYFGFDLPAFDAYLCEPGWDTEKARAVRRRLVRNREDLIDAWRMLDEHRLLAFLAAEGWANFLQTCMQLDEQREWLLPLARSARKHSKDQAARRMDKPASDPYDSGRNDRIRNHHKKLSDADATDATAQTAAAFSLHPRSIRRIVAAK